MWPNCNCNDRPATDECHSRAPLLPPLASLSLFPLSFSCLFREMPQLGVGLLWQIKIHKHFTVTNITHRHVYNISNELKTSSAITCKMEAYHQMSPASSRGHGAHKFFSHDERILCRNNRSSSSLSLISECAPMAIIPIQSASFIPLPFPFRRRPQ